jgi:hypothetical protein
MQALILARFRHFRQHDAIDRALDKIPQSSKSGAGRGVQVHAIVGLMRMGT